MQAFDDIARDQLEGIAKSLQLPTAAFLPILDSKALNCKKQSSSSLEAIHYLLPEGAAADVGAPEACEAHEDKGMLTLIYADTQQGLQVGWCMFCWLHIVLPMLNCYAVNEEVCTACMSDMQVQKPDGTWKHLLLAQGQIAVLAGYTLERATCGLVKAAKHKVVCPALKQGWR